jgi:hypothetical protein
MRTRINIVFVTLTVLAAINLWLSCSSLKDASKEVAGAVIDCTKRQTAATVRELRPLMSAVFTHVVDNAGRMDYGKVKELAKDYATDVARCAVADTIARLINPPNEVGFAPVHVDRDAARAGFRELYPGVKFKTESGEL